MLVIFMVSASNVLYSNILAPKIPAANTNKHLFLLFQALNYRQILNLLLFIMFFFLFCFVQYLIYELF